MKKLYLKNGYFNFSVVIESDTPFVFVVGGRGTGKTFGALEYAIESNERFLYMRRTQTQLDILNNDEFSPFKNGTNDVYLRKINKQLGGVYNQDNNLIGYTAALSTLSNIRGFSGQDIKLIIYDEFIPEKHERLIKGETDALLNAYETINRNRELTGENPVKLVCLANSNRLDNPIFTDLDLIPLVQKQIKRGSAYHEYDDIGVCIILLINSGISDKKSNTALYRLATDEYAEMALNNNFLQSEYHCKHQPIVEYKPLIKYDRFYLYRHKAHNRIYVSTYRMGTFQEMSNEEFKKLMFPVIKSRLINNELFFDNFNTKSKFILKSGLTID